MPTYGNKQCQAPSLLYQDLLAQGLPVDWYGKPSSYTCPLGCEAGTGWILLSRKDLDNLSLSAPYDLVLQSGAGQSVTIKNLIIVQATNLAPSADGAKTAPYLVELADRRRLWRTVPISSGYNVRKNATGTAVGDYYSDTLNSGALWTWESLVTDIWDTIGQLGAFPGLPFSPNGSPEGMQFYSSYAMDALTAVLDRLGCALRLNPFDETYSIVRLGAADPAPDQKIADLTSQGLRHWTTEPVENPLAQVPEKVRVNFPIRSDGTGANGCAPWHSVDITGTVAGTQIGTCAVLIDDLHAQFDSSDVLQNSSALNARAQERADDFFRKSTAARMNVTLIGIHSDIALLPGAQVKAIRWEEVGDGYKTTVAWFPGLLAGGNQVASPEGVFQSNAQGGIWQSSGWWGTDSPARLWTTISYLRDCLGGSNSSGGSGSITVAEEDGTPSYASITTIQFDQDQGFTVTNPSSGVALVQIGDAGTGARGVVNFAAQTFGGEKTFNDRLFVNDGINVLGDGTGGGTDVIHFGVDDLSFIRRSDNSTYHNMTMRASRPSGQPTQELDLTLSSQSRKMLLGGTLSSYPPIISMETSSGVFTDGATGTYSGVTDITVQGGIVTSVTTGAGGGITSLNGLSGSSQTFVDDTNVTMVSSGTTHTLTWSGTLAWSRIAAISTLTLDDVAVADSIPIYDVSGTANDRVTVERLGGYVNPATNDFRLSNKTGDPLGDTGLATATSVFCVPYKGNRMALYDGTRWVLTVLAEKSYALSALTNDTLYDVFMDYNSGSPILALTQWTNNTTRATAIVYQDGILVKSGDATHRYLGTIRPTESIAGQKNMLVDYYRMFIWNLYHQIPRELISLDASGSWTYASTSWRQMRGSTANQIEFVLGLKGSVQAEVKKQVNADATISLFSIGEDSTTTPAFTVMGDQTWTPGSSDIVTTNACYSNELAEGYHFLCPLEKSNTAVTVTSYGGLNAGIRGRVMG